MFAKDVDQMNERMTEILLDGNIQGSLRNEHRRNTTGVICTCDIYKGCGPSAKNIGLNSPLKTFLESPLASVTSLCRTASS